MLLITDEYIKILDSTYNVVSRLVEEARKHRNRDLLKMSM